MNEIPVVDFVESADRAGGFWAAITGHKAIFAYIVILLVALLAMMFLLILRSAKDAKAKAKLRRSGKRRFSRLHELDERGGVVKEYEENVKLDEFCARFRDFAASEMGLYYDADVIRAFVASLSVTRLVIMQGISGTGKTSLAYAFGRFIGNESPIIPVQPSWKDKTDMLGYYNEFTGAFTETELLYKLYEAGASKDVYTVVLDEMNIARVEYYFAEFLSVLELPDLRSRMIEVVSDKRESDPKRLIDGKLLIPDNVWFVGTANNDDSTLAISDKVYDRAFVIEMDRRSLPFNAPETKKKRISAERLESLFAAARAETKVSDETKNKLAALDEYLISGFQITFGNRIMRQTENFIPVYIACGGTETEALDIMIRGKIMRKLEALNPVYVRAHAEGLVEEINRLFGRGALVSTLEYINKYRNG